MPELHLTRSPDDRRLYVLEDVGTLRLTDVASREATACAGDESWQLSERGIWLPVIQAADPAGVIVGEYRHRALQRGGVLRWSDRLLTLEPESRRRERYFLADGDRELAIIEGRGWGRDPVTITVDAPGALDAGPLLFAAFVVRAIAHNTQAAAS